MGEGTLARPPALPGRRQHQREYQQRLVAQSSPSSGGPQKGLAGGLWGTGGTQARRCYTGPQRMTTVSWSRCSSLQVPGAPDLVHFFLPHSWSRAFVAGCSPSFRLCPQCLPSFHCFWAASGIFQGFPQCSTLFALCLGGIFTVFPVSPDLFSPSSTPLMTSFVHRRSRCQTRSLWVRVIVRRGP